MTNSAWLLYFPVFLLPNLIRPLGGQLLQCCESPSPVLGCTFNIKHYDSDGTNPTITNPQGTIFPAEVKHIFFNFSFLPSAFGSKGYCCHSACPSIYPSMPVSPCPSTLFNTLRPRQNSRHFAEDLFKCIFLNENIWISNEISLKFVPKGPVDNIPSLFQIMAWRRPGDKPLSEPMMVRLPTHIGITRLQWILVSPWWMIIPWRDFLSMRFFKIC